MSVSSDCPEALGIALIKAAGNAHEPQRRAAIARWLRSALLAVEGAAGDERSSFEVGDRVADATLVEMQSRLQAARAAKYAREALEELSTIVARAAELAEFLTEMMVILAPAP